MTNEQAMQAPGAPAKLFGGAERLSRLPLGADKIDAGFEKSGRRISGFAISSGLDAGRAGRDLVAAGLVSPDDPRILASQDAPNRALVDQMRSGEGLAQVAGGIAAQLSDRPLDRDVAARLNGLKRVVAKAPGKLTPDMVAGTFEDVTSLAAERGDPATSALAGRAFLAATQAGVEASRERTSTKVRQDAER